jgi:hypothetical protein
MNILFGKRKSSKHLTTLSNSVISADFAQEVLYLEEQLNINCSMRTVTRLIELYTKAIEYYEAEKNLKHIHYQERMQNLLSRTNVIQLFNSNPVKSSPIKAPSIKETSIRENRIKVAPVKDNLTRDPPVKTFTKKTNLTINPDLVLDRTCEKVIKDHNRGNSNISKKIQENLKDQYEELQKKLFFRRQTPKSSSSSFFSPVNQCDISAGQTSHSMIEFEKEVENIVEKYFEEKINAKQNIEERYKEYFFETKFMKGEIGNRLLEELKKNMHKDIESKLIEIDAKKNDEITAARLKLNQNNLAI